MTKLLMSVERNVNLHTTTTATNNNLIYNHKEMHSSEQNKMYVNKIK